MFSINNLLVVLKAFQILADFIFELAHFQNKNSIIFQEFFV